MNDEAVSTLSRRGRSLANLQNTITQDMNGERGTEHKHNESVAMPARRVSQLVNQNTEASKRLKTSDSGLSPVNRYDLTPSRGKENKHLRKSQGHRMASVLHQMESIKEVGTRSGRNTSMSQTQYSTSKGDETSKLKKENIKARVAYEWKQIFKTLNKFDSDQTGLASKA